LLVIDEAAAIPLPMVKKLLGPYLVFMSSTVNGYEGTGRSLSLKLVKQLRSRPLPLSPAHASIAVRVYVRLCVAVFDVFPLPQATERGQEHRG
jgi:N-acetyltransferase 10